jgi:hypothetical protein
VQQANGRPFPSRDSNCPVREDMILWVMQQTIIAMELNLLGAHLFCVIVGFHGSHALLLSGMTFDRTFCNVYLTTLLFSKMNILLRSAHLRVEI